MKNLLYIDDNEGDSYAMSQYFADSDYVLNCVDNAIVGFAELAKEGYDMVICDIMMPGTDGLEFAKRLSGMGIKIPIILTSGIPTLKSFEHYNGIKNYLGFLLKPITPQSLDNFLRKSS